MSESRVSWRWGRRTRNVRVWATRMRSKEVRTFVLSHIIISVLTLFDVSPFYVCVCYISCDHETKTTHGIWADSKDDSLILVFFHRLIKCWRHRLFTACFCSNRIIIIIIIRMYVCCVIQQSIEPDLIGLEFADCRELNALSDWLMGKMIEQRIFALYAVQIETLKIC